MIRWQCAGWKVINRSRCQLFLPKLPAYAAPKANRQKGRNRPQERPEEDSNSRQHDGVGAEIGLQRLFAQSRGSVLKPGVSASRPTRKVPTNGCLLAVSPTHTKRGGLVGGAGSRLLTRLCAGFPVFQGINRDVAARMAIRPRKPLQTHPFLVHFQTNSLPNRTGN